MTTIFIGNVWVLVLLARFRRLRNCANYFTASMAFADFLLSIALIPGVKITFDPTFISNINLCLMLWCSQIFASTMSVLSLLCVSIDRLVKIVKPLRYQTIVTEERTLVVIFLIWTYGTFSVVVLPFAGLRNDDVLCFDFAHFFNFFHLHVLFLLNGFLPFIIILAMYMYMFKIVSGKHVSAKQFEPTSLRSYSIWKRELKTLSNLALIIGFTGVAWLPSITLVLIDLHIPTLQASLTARTILSWFTYLNSAVNPIVYALRSEQFKTATMQLLKRDLSSVCQKFVTTRRNRVHPSGDTTVRRARVIQTDSTT
ncbi:Alpha-1A adrenergic receptor [Holothuria leucospilota]|uniref:Alpha-1A adrenergic receptor n=1 Tax=Holothuria leucospilota TaxID=206669 RepID=A0A9Q1BT50_HOLLE|nr:Alpha-1A adrenergic receptor [Holothuria leucospilota]